MSEPIPKATLSPPAGRPNWRGGGSLPLLYLGWGQRNFADNPLPLHTDLGTNHYLVLRGEVVLTVQEGVFSVKGPVAMIFDPDAAFGIGQREAGPVEILVWIWEGRPKLQEICPNPAGYRAIPLQEKDLPTFAELHDRCRSEVARADSRLPETLGALHTLLEVELARVAQPSGSTDDIRWQLAEAWMAGNLHVQAPVPALCEYLGMSTSSLHRFFIKHRGESPGAYFRNLKRNEALRLIQEQGWQVKTAAYHLGYKQPNDLSRALAGRHFDRTMPVKSLSLD